jgi:hypothetical protein
MFVAKKQKFCLVAIEIAVAHHLTRVAVIDNA